MRNRVLGCAITAALFSVPLAVSAAEYVDLFDATMVTASGGNNGLGATEVNINKRFVFGTKETTVYCAGSATAYVMGEYPEGVYGPPLVDNFMTGGTDTASICQGGSAISGTVITSGTHCFASATARTRGQPMENFYSGPNVTAPVELVEGENNLTFKLWDYGIDYGNTKLVLALPEACSSTPPPIQVGIDIKPGSNPNSINLCTSGVVTVAILGSADFDVSTIDAGTLALGTATPRMVGKGNKSSCNIKDVSGDFSESLEGMPDGYLDLVCQYDTVDLGDFSGQSSATVTGFLYGGQAFVGTDTINIVKDSCLD